MSNSGKYPQAHEALGSVQNARVYLGGLADELAQRIGRVVVPVSPDESPHPRERGEKVEAERRRLSRRIAQASQTATRLRNELDRMKEALRAIDDEVRNIEARGLGPEVTAGLTALALLSAGTPFCSRGFADLISQLDWFLARAKSAGSKRAKHQGASRTSLENKGVLFNLAVNVAELEAQGIPVKPKDLAAAEVIATGKVRRTSQGAASAIRVWERRLAKAREVLPGFRQMLDLPSPDPMKDRETHDVGTCGSTPAK